MWLGSARSGMQLNLQGTEQAAVAAASSCGNDENGQLQCENLSDAQFNVALGSREWHNANRGGASVVTQPAEAGGAPVVMLTVYTGRLAVLRPGERLTLHWRLLLTPVRGSGAPLRADFGTRYFHMQRFVSVEQVRPPPPKRPAVCSSGSPATCSLPAACRLLLTGLPAACCVLPARRPAYRSLLATHRRPLAPRRRWRARRRSRGSSCTRATSSSRTSTTPSSS